MPPSLFQLPWLFLAFSVSSNKSGKKPQIRDLEVYGHRNLHTQVHTGTPLVKSLFPLVVYNVSGVTGALTGL